MSAGTSWPFGWLFRRLPVVEVTMTGFCMRLGGAPLTPGRQFWLAAAGPGANALLAVLWYARASARLTVWDGAFLAANILTGAFNLLPVPTRYLRVGGAPAGSCREKIAFCAQIG